MFIAWLLASKKQLQVTIIDKTVLDKDGQEHISMMWVLNHEKYVNHNNSFYKTAKDYFGFFPKRNEAFEIKGLERFSNKQLDSLSLESDVVNLTDAYGIYHNEWYSKQNTTERSGMIYGGMSSQDVYFLKRMKEQKKLVLTEFNCLGSPTEKNVRTEFEEAFKIRWTGWIGRYFDVLDTAVNAELPKWLIRNYIRQHGSWPFKKSGIAFVKENDRVVILENQTHLTKELPEMVSFDLAGKHYNLPASINYSFWFDIIETDSSNSVLANFRINVNENGRKQLSREGIPSAFPAIVAHNKTDYKFWYFACDFSDNPISTTTSYFKGISFFKRMFYNSTDPAQRGSFFWDVYRPLVTTILNEYKAELR